MSFDRSVPPEARAEAAKMEQERSSLRETERAVDEGIDGVMTSLAERFELHPSQKERLPFHDRVHTQGVVDRTGNVLAAVRRAAPELVSERTIAVGKLAAAYHDLIQEWEPNDIADGDKRKVLRKRFAAKNEAASAEEAVAYMRSVNEKKKAEGAAEVFSEADMAAVREAIDATIPGFDPEKGTVIQPKLTPESSAIARAVALADLGEAGTDSAGFLRGGDALFREENLDVLDAMNDPASLTAGQKEYFRQRMLGWSKFQPKFAAGRKALLDKELSGLPEAARAEVAMLFTEFDRSIEAASEVAKRREGMTFEQLAADLGYRFSKEDSVPTSQVA